MSVDHVPILEITSLLKASRPPWNRVNAYHLQHLPMSPLIRSPLPLETTSIKIMALKTLLTTATYANLGMTTSKKSFILSLSKISAMPMSAVLAFHHPSPHGHPYTHSVIHPVYNGYGILPPELLPLKLLPNVRKCFTSRGIATIKLDLRKQCRRNHLGAHCPPIKPGREQFTLVMSTAIEMLIATRVFKLQIISTIAFSSSVASIGRGLDAIQS
ncbi:hypothetical protein FALBO_3994 [Fusarium albosuccineum]|uniref:Uncharacterized protein n=1 Tax=Fusarium albosuccineum TaxID=1237068 RepID=A0A8H4LK59_9HYPO|nr:hypothetical protein FALBO_3994 [Fusarium albosuccineum]